MAEQRLREQQYEYNAVCSLLFSLFRVYLLLATYPHSTQAHPHSHTHTRALFLFSLTLLLLLLLLTCT